MKKVKFLFIASILILSSCKKEGCTDQGANNFDEEAKKDDGSCTYNPKIGEEYEGGFIFHVFEPVDEGFVEGEFHGLITTKLDQAVENKWGCTEALIEATDEKIGAGSKNTNLILDNCSDAEIAAMICNEFSYNGYNDWYLPSKDELNKIYENKDLIGGTASATYWSSSEYDKDMAWGQSFSTGSQNPLSKDNTFRVKAIRKF